MEQFFQIKKTKIEVGLKREYRFFQISDMHMACKDEQSSLTDIEDNARFHREWGKMKYEFAEKANEFCDERYDMEPSTIFEMLANRALEFKADALILSGDIFDRVTESNLRYIKNFINKFSIPVIYCLGNHAYSNEKGEHLNQYERFKGIVDNPEFDSFDFGEFDIVTVDNGTKRITDKQIESLKEKLSQNKKILLVLHAPLNMGEFKESLGTKISPYFLQGVTGDCENAFKFNEIIEQNDDKVIAVLTGHIHFFAEGHITDNVVQYTTSSGLIAAGREIIIK